MEVPRAPLERVMRNAGAERIAEGAAERLREAVQELADEICEDAITIAEKDGRGTIMIEDVKHASEA